MSGGSNNNHHPYTSQPHHSSFQPNTPNFHPNPQQPPFPHQQPFSHQPHYGYPSANQAAPDFSQPPFPQHHNPHQNSYQNTAAQPDHAFSHLAPDFDASGTSYTGGSNQLPLNNNFAHQLHQPQWDQQVHFAPQSGTEQPHAQAGYAHQPSSYPHQANPSEQPFADDIATPPPQHFEVATPSPQKPTLRVKLKRVTKTNESSAGGQQAQAQLQIEPTPNMSGRPSRAAALNASASMSALSDSAAGRNLRLRHAKKEPGSEEDYQEDVSDHRKNDNRGSHPLRNAHLPNWDLGSTSGVDSQETGAHVGDRKGRRKSRSSSSGKTFPVAIRRSGRNQSRSSSQAPTSSQTPATSQSLRIGESRTPQPRRSTRRSGDSAPESSQDVVSEQMPSATQRLPGQTRAPSVRRSSRRRDDVDAQDDDDEDAEADDDAEGEQDVGVKNDDDDEHHEPEPIMSRSRSGRVRIMQKESMAESDDSEAGRDDDDEDEEVVRATRRTSRRLPSNSLGGFVAADDEDDEDDEGEYGSRSKTRSGRVLRRGNSSSSNRLQEMAAKKRAANGRGRHAKKVIDDEFEMDGDDTPEEDHISGAEDDPLDLHSDEPEGSQGKSYSLRQRKKVNYSLVPPPPSPPRDGFGRAIRNNRGRPANGAYEIDPATTGAASGPGTGAALPMPFPGRGKKGKEGWDALPSSMTGKDYARIFGDPVDSSDDELQNNALRKPGGPAALGGGAAGGLLGAGGAGGAGGLPGGLTGSGGTDSFGRIKKSGDPLADVDPLGVDMNIDFDSVGGLDGHIQQLKEMVMLPLLYPEVFQRFKVTPPRGVLFHGPPGTGKTLVARALAASCSTEGQQVSFFMRKGADCLSKWVGEAERQLRLLFEEARASQPSIIFFDEIDGLAPVRSSKQDQIHASIVSTMLALMDGMDGRGQVVVIGATNRPDSVDPALRRPGRFDREFYFPLPSLEARKSIINIHTRKWEPPLDDDFKARLAEVTKGYGGADLRALCTEAALNAIQRRYPQIYSTTDRLLLDPASIQVDAKDFMMSVNKIVPSSARASASAAAPLPERLAPLLGNVVQDAISVLDRILPPVSKRNPLEEALWEDDTFVPNGLTSGMSAADMLAGDRGFGREMLLQSFEAQRVYRPRMLVHGEAGMGQGAVGAALLQHLEGYHVQSLDIGTLLGDSARTPEAAIIQLFVEAKRHKPSVLYIPGLVHWARSVSEGVKTTFKALLDGLTDADPVMLLGIAEAPLDELDDEVQSWFNFLDDDLVQIRRPDDESRRAFFKEIFDHVIRPPTEFPDALPRRKRVLEELPKAPPRPPRKLTQAELQQQADNDAKLLEHLKYRLGPVLAELRKKFKKFTRDVWDEYNLRELTQQFEWTREKGKVTIELRYYRPGLAAQQAREDDADDINGMLETEADVAAKRGITAAQFNSPEPSAVAAGDEAADAVGAEAEAPSAAAAVAGETGDVEMANGDSAAAVNGFNGVNASGEASSAAADGVAPPSSQPNGVGAAHANGEADGAGGDASTGPADTTGAAGAATDEYVTRTMPIWTTNLEKMQKRLYYNGYLSCSAFMEDIQKIVENAEEAAEVDQERVFRAHQMRNLAIVLMDQYIDAGFREECDRMALRQMAREQEAREATEKAKQSAEEAAKKAAESAKGERASARIAGKEVDAAMLGDVGAIERGAKRQRSTSAQADVPTATPQGSEGAEGAEGGNEISVEEVGEGVVVTEGVEESRKRARVESPVVHPPLTYTAASYVRLTQHIVASTATYSIDQLARLRAAAFSAIWQHRSDWDRDELIGRLIEITAKSQQAVARERSLRQ